MTTSSLAAAALAASGDPLTIAPPLQTAAAAPPPPVDVQAAVNAALSAERERVAALDALAIPGYEALIADAKRTGLSAGDAAVALVGKIKADGRLDAISALRNATAQVPAVPSAPHDPVGGAGGALAALPEGVDRWKAEYAALPEKHRGDYPTEEAFLSARRRGEPAPK